jgi:hypothetical protein
MMGPWVDFFCFIFTSPFSNLHTFPCSLQTEVGDSLASIIVSYYDYDGIDGVNGDDSGDDDDDDNDAVRRRIGQGGSHRRRRLRGGIGSCIQTNPSFRPEASGDDDGNGGEDDDS